MNWSKIFLSILIAITLYGCAAPKPVSPITHPPFAISQFNKYEVKIPYNATIEGNLHCYSPMIGYLPVNKCVGEKCYFETTNANNEKKRLSMWPCKIFFLFPKGTQ